MSTFSDEQMWIALRTAKGNYSRAAKLLSKVVGVDFYRGVVWDRVNKNEKHKKKYQQLKESLLDEMEEQLQQLTQGAESDRVKLDSIKYYLNNQGKSRGWNAETEQSNDFNVSIHLGDSKDNELENPDDYESAD